MNAPIAPFTPQHVQMVKDALRQLNAARDLMAKLENCGVNCDEHRQLADVIETGLSGLRREFLEPQPQLQSTGG